MIAGRRQREGEKAVAALIENGGRGRFIAEQPQCFCGICQKPVTKRPLAVDKTTDGPLVDAKAPRKCSGAAKQLDAISKMLASFVDG